MDTLEFTDMLGDFLSVSVNGFIPEDEKVVMHVHERVLEEWQDAYIVLSDEQVDQLIFYLKVYREDKQRRKDAADNKR